MKKAEPPLALLQVDKNKSLDSLAFLLFIVIRFFSVGTF
jgi:hypothetical protein